MKFGKKIRKTVYNSLPAWRPYFLDYKLLKQILSQKDNNNNSTSSSVVSTPPPNSDTVASSGGRNLTDLEEGLGDGTVAREIAAARSNELRKEDVERIEKEREEVVQRLSTSDGNGRPDLIERGDDGGERKGKSYDGGVEVSRRFFEVLRREVDKVNEFYLDKEEDYIIQWEMVEKGTLAFMGALRGMGYGGGAGGIGAAVGSLGDAMESNEEIEIEIDGGNDQQGCQQGRQEGSQVYQRPQGRGSAHPTHLSSAERLLLVRARVMDHLNALIKLHGEMVLLENFCTVNYTAIRKILKKHDKKRNTGFDVRVVYMQAVLTLPFLQSGMVGRLIKKAERLIEKLEAFK